MTLDSCHAKIADMESTRLCDFPDCGRKHVAHGLCATHYKQQKDGVPLVPVKQFWPVNHPSAPHPPRECDFDGCRRIAHSMGYCHAHRAQLSKGKELTPIKPRHPLYV